MKANKPIQLARLRAEVKHAGGNAIQLEFAEIFLKYLDFEAAMNYVNSITKRPYGKGLIVREG